LMRTRTKLRREMGSVMEEGALRPEQETWQQTTKRSFECVKGDLRRGESATNEG
jgi:hypothetical protein